MIIGDVGGVSDGNNIPWNKKLAEELDAADGKKDGKINANIWNDFMKSTGSKGNKIKNFINLNNAERSLNFYDKKKDAGKVDWGNWETLLNNFKVEKGLAVEQTEPVQDDPPIDEIVDPDNNLPVDTEEKPEVTQEQQAKFDKLKESGVLDDKPHTPEALKEGGFGVKPQSLNSSDSAFGLYQQDENGLYYIQDMNGGRTYTNEKGESIRISEFEASMVEGGKVEVTYISSDGKTKNHIIYGENDKPIQGFTTVTGDSWRDMTTYEYTYDAGGNKVLKGCTEPKQDVSEEQAAFNELKESGVLDEKPHTPETLKEGGFGVKPQNANSSDSGFELYQQDENGLYYIQDMNGGRTYTNGKGEFIRISEFEAGLVEGGKVQVSSSSADGKVQNNIIYDENNKPISGFVVIRDGDKTTTMSYTFDADGNKILQPSNKDSEITEEAKADFIKNSPINALQNGQDVESLDLSGYKKTLLNYQGTELYTNVQTGEQVYIERSFGPGGYKNLSITYTKDGITQVLKFNAETGKVESNEVRAAVPEDTIELAGFPTRGNVGLIPETQLTKYNNKVSHSKDENGNTVIRVDYGNNDGEFFDEEEVRTPDGKLVSYTTETYSADKSVRYYKKRMFDNDGKLVKVTETTYENGKVKETKDLPVEDEPEMSATVHVGVPVDGVHGDPELKEIIRKLGGGVIGNN